MQIKDIKWRNKIKIPKPQKNLFNKLTKIEEIKNVSVENCKEQNIEINHFFENIVKKY